MVQFLLMEGVKFELNVNSTFIFVNGKYSGATHSR